MRWNEDMKKRQRWRVRWREKADESGITEVTAETYVGETARGRRNMSGMARLGEEMLKDRKGEI